MNDVQKRVELALKLRRARIAKGLSTTQVARQTGFSQSKVSRIDLGKTTPSVLETYTLCRVLDLQPSLRLQVLGDAETLNQPVQVQSRRPPTRFPQHDWVDLIRDCKRHRVSAGPYLPVFAQTPDYMLRMGNPTLDKGTSEKEFIANKMRISAESYSLDRDICQVFHEQAIAVPVLSTKQWLEQLRHFLQRVNYVNAAIGILPSTGETPGRGISVLDRSVTCTEVGSDWDVSFDRANAISNERTIQADNDRSLWGLEAIRLVEEHLRKFEMAIDIRDPQRYYSVNESR